MIILSGAGDVTNNDACDLHPDYPTSDLEFDHSGACLTGSDGDTIALWVDSSAEANDLTNASSTSRPNVKLGILNGLSVARYGINVLPSVMAFDAGLTLSSFTYIAVMKCTKNTASDPATLIGGSALENGAAQVRIFQNKISLVKQSIVEIGVSSTNVGTTNFRTVGVTYDGTTATFYLDGSADGTATNAQTFTAQTQSQGKGPDQNFEGDIAQDSLWSRVLSGGELTDVFDALRDRWAHY